jgi:hypothetical protein
MCNHQKELGMGSQAEAFDAEEWTLSGDTGGSADTSEYLCKCLE